MCFTAQTQTIPANYQSLFPGKNAAEQVRLADSLSAELRNTKPEQAIALSLYGLRIAKENKLHEPAVKACLSISRTYRSKGAHDTSLAWTDSAHGYAVANDLRAQYGHIFDYQGLVYMRMGNYTKATRSFYLSILWSEKENDSLRLHDAFDHLGTVSFYRSEFRTAIYYYQKSLRYIPANAPPRPYAVTADNIGTAYTNLDIPDSALYYQQRVVNMVGALYDSTFEAEVFINISTTLVALERYEEAASYLDRAYAISTATHNNYGLINANLYKGRLLRETGKPREALPYLETAYELAVQLKIPVMIKQTASSLSEVYKSIGDYRKASEYYEILTEAMLTVAKEENQKAINELSTRYDNEKQQQQIKLLTLDAEVKEQVIRNDRNIKFIYGAVAIMFLVVSGIFIYRFLEKRKANRLLQEKTEAIARQKNQIETQKEELQVKNREITDSIHYAKRIQHAVIPSDKLVHALLPDSFIYFRPKDIVSGDFYWAMEKMQAGRRFIYFAVADCTGHGVPGAMMSMLATSLLNQLVADGPVKMPAGILPELHQAVVKALNEDIGRRALQDGMDMALLLIDPAEKKLHFAGAARPLYIAPEGESLRCIRGDKFSIGDNSGMSDLRFTSHTIDFSRPVTLYLFSDGVPDQFGGPKGKKFMLKQLVETLEAGLNFPIAEQERRFAAVLETWMQGCEQTDDITLAGIRLA
ncbi:MAG: protein serine/threonine phosphatase [Bacteroidetes bacterium]|nr:MAG: protein serine/threonine phosphatase [Bacteroidota bacterium]